MTLDPSPPLPPSPPSAGNPAEGPPELQIDGANASVHLRRHSRRNAINDGDLLALHEICDRIDAARAVRVVQLRADGGEEPRPVFCAGYDFAGLAQGEDGPRRFETLVDRWAALRPITIGVASGSVHGGGTDLLLACDLRVGLHGCQFRMPAVQMGLHLYPGGLRRYVQMLGVAGAKRAFFVGRPLSFEWLLDQGLFEELAYDAMEVDAAAWRLAQRIASLSPQAAQSTKRSIREIADGEFDAGRLRERELGSLRSRDFAEGLAATAERRTPLFRDDQDGS